MIPEPDLSTLRFAPEEEGHAFLRHPSPALLFEAATGRIVAANIAASHLYGWTRDELARMTLAELHPPESRAALADALGRLDRAVSFWHRTRHWHRDGASIEVESLLQPMQLDGHPVWRAVVLDVTDRERAVATLAESERRFRAAFEQSVSGMALTATTGRFLRVNRALCDMLGYTPEEMTGRSFQQLTHPDDVSANLSLLQAAMRGEIPGYQLEKRFLHRDGHVVWGALNVAVVRDERDVPQYLVSQTNDITSRKRAEVALMESEAKLRQAQKMEAIGRLAGGVAHDFNNLLTVIRSNAEIGVEMAREGLGPVNEFSEISAAVARAASLTRQLLAFSRQQVLAPAAIPINEVVAESQRMLRRVIGVDVRLETRLDAAAGEVVADRGQLEQVLMNLVVNARDAMPDGGRVVIATRRDADGRVTLAVTDNGSGMDAETRARAFEPFFTTKPLGKGTGLGLSTVYGIARQSGGDVTITSEPGAGTTVTLILPPSVPRAAEVDVVDRAADHRAGPSPEVATILVVEDEPGVRAVVRRMLERFGHRVLEAQDGAEALATWERERASVRLVLSDALMPVMGGSELAALLRAAGADVPVLFMSGNPDGDGGRGVPGGAELIRKPFSADQLRDRVAALLARARPGGTGQGAAPNLPPG